MIQVVPNPWAYLENPDSVDWRNSNHVWYELVSINGKVTANTSTQRAMSGYIKDIEALINQVDAQENKRMSLDAHLEAADEKTLAMQLFDVTTTFARPIIEFWMPEGTP